MKAEVKVVGETKNFNSIREKLRQKSENNKSHLKSLMKKKFHQAKIKFFVGEIEFLIIFMNQGASEQNIDF